MEGMNGILVLIVLVCGGGVIFCCWGAYNSYKNEKQRKKMQHAADLVYKTKNGKYSFNYMIKGFNKSEGKQIKVIIDPVLGFSDLPYASTNACHNAIVRVESNHDHSLIKEFKFDYEVRSLSPDISFLLGTEFQINNVYDVNITIETNWSLGANSISERLSSNYKG